MNTNRKNWQIAPTTYEQMTPRRLRKYATPIWALVMVMIFSTNVLFRLYLQETEQILTTIFLTLIAILLPIILWWVRNVLLNLGVQLATFIDLDEQNLRDWSCSLTHKTISGNWLKWACGIFIVFAGTATILYLGIPLENEVLHLVAITSLIPLFFFCGTAAYNMLYGLTIPLSIARLPIRVPLYQDRYSGVTSLNWIIFSTSLIALLLYALLFGAIITGPYSLGNLMFLWLSILGLLVALVFPVSLWGLHNAMNKAKRDALLKLARHLEKAVQETVESPAKNNLEFVKSLFEFRNELEKLPEWPIDFKTTITLLTTILVPILGFVIDLATKK